MPSIRTRVKQELLWSFLEDIDLSQPLSHQVGNIRLHRGGLYSLDVKRKQETGSWTNQFLPFILDGTSLDTYLNLKNIFGTYNVFGTYKHIANVNPQNSRNLFQLDVWDKKNNLFLAANNEDQPDRKRSASLIAYTDKEKKKAPGLDQFQMERQKVELREVYSRNKKV